MNHEGFRGTLFSDKPSWSSFKEQWGGVSPEMIHHEGLNSSIRRLSGLWFEQSKLSIFFLSNEQSQRLGWVGCQRKGSTTEKNSRSLSCDCWDEWGSQRTKIHGVFQVGHFAKSSGSKSRPKCYDLMTFRRSREGFSDWFSDLQEVSCGFQSSFIPDSLLIGTIWGCFGLHTSFHGHDFYPFASLCLCLSRVAQRHVWGLKDRTTPQGNFLQ